MEKDPVRCRVTGESGVLEQPANNPGNVDRFSDGYALPGNRSHMAGMGFIRRSDRSTGMDSSTIVRRSNCQSVNMRTTMLLPAVAAVVSVLLVPVLDFGSGSNQSLLEPIADTLQISDCGFADNADSPYWSEITGPDQRIQSLYQCPRGMFQLDVSRFLVQKAGKEAITDGNRVIESRFVSAARPRFLELPGGLEIREYQIDRNLQAGVVWTWYAVGDEPSAGAMEAKLSEVGQVFSGEAAETAIITLIAWDQDPVSAQKRLERLTPLVWNWYLARGDA